jgi:hypothetical protein
MMNLFTRCTVPHEVRSSKLRDDAPLATWRPVADSQQRVKGPQLLYGKVAWSRSSVGSHYYPLPARAARSRLLRLSL